LCRPYILTGFALKEDDFEAIISLMYSVHTFYFDLMTIVTGILNIENTAYIMCISSVLVHNGSPVITLVHML
jgi:hypothetical protein